MIDMNRNLNKRDGFPARFLPGPLRGFRAASVFLVLAVLMGSGIPSGLLAADAADDPANAGTGSGSTLLVEAESFRNLGGWKLDTQFMDQMGSPMLLAHGMGVPVKDALTMIDLPEPGRWRVWVRTRDWVATFGAHGAPGRFEVRLNNRSLKPVFGTEGAAWHWQDGGFVDLPGGRTQVALHDLTGFEGRCDALLFSLDPDLVPPDDAPDAWRRPLSGLDGEPEDGGTYDLVVTGGGLAGICAAVAAARQGLEVALIQNRPVLGGNNSSEVRVHLGGKIRLPPFTALGELVAELDTGLRGNAQPAHHYDDALKLRVVEGEQSLKLFLNHHAFAVEGKQGRIDAVLARHTRSGRILRFRAPRFADCTGDGNLGFLAGADFRMGREGRDETGESLAPEDADAMTMGASIQWYSAETEAPSPFPDCPWGLRFDESNCQRVFMGEWDWEVGMDRHQIRDFEAVRDHAFRAIYGNWAFLKNRSADRAKYANRRLDWMAFIGGKRESRRLLGDVILTEQDVVEARPFPDACVTTTWTIDLHYPREKNAKQFPEGAFRSVARHRKIAPYAIPYRCLYSRNVKNLFMAGRCISVTHVALGTVRVMRTTGMMGEVVGLAATVCDRHDCSPRDVYEKHLDELIELLKIGAGMKPRE